MVTSRSRTDAELVAELLLGSAGAGEAALAQIFRRHGGAVLSFVAHCTGDRSVAEHVVEEVFVHLWRQPRCFDPSAGSLRSHLVKDGHWRCVGLVRLEESHPNQSGQEQHEEGWRALNLDERLAVGLVQLGEMTIAEVAEVLGVDEDTVHSRLTRGLRSLLAGGRTAS